MPATIAEGGLLGAAFGERAGGLAFEVEDDVVAAGAEELAEVVVAVDADALAGLLRSGISVMARARAKSSTRRERMRAAESAVRASIGEGVEGVLQGVEGAGDLEADAGGVGGEELRR